jgi:hypothetical protein
VSFFPGNEVNNSVRMGDGRQQRRKRATMRIVARFFATHLLPRCFYPPLAPRSLRIFAHADGPTSLTRGGAHWGRNFVAGTLGGVVVVGKEEGSTT